MNVTVTLRKLYSWKNLLKALMVPRIFVAPDGTLIFFALIGHVKRASLYMYMSK